MSKRRKQGIYFHVHHNLLLEWCWDYDERVSAINSNKPSNEIETRLRLFRPFKGKLPAEVVKTNAACVKAYDAREKANAARIKAYDAWAKATAACVKKATAAFAKATAACVRADDAWVRADDAWKEICIKYHKEIETLHAKECGCKEWNGKKLVFPKEGEK